MSEAVAALLGLEQQLRRATDPSQLYFTVVNQLDRCVPFTLAVMLVGDQPGRADVMAISDVPTVDYTSPFVLWVERLAKHCASKADDTTQQVLTPSGVPAELASEWRELGLPECLLWQPLPVEARDNTPAGVLLLFAEQEWTSEELGVSGHLSASIGHALFALRRHRPLAGLWQRLRQRRLFFALVLLVLVILFLPVRLTTLAPAEVIADSPAIVAAPLDGVVASVDVMPNQQVVPGDVLARMENSDLESEAEVARQALAVARARLLTAQQSGFMDPTQKARLAELQADVSLNDSRLKYAEARLQRSVIRAESAGIAVLEDPAEWRGRPVKTGERILQVADPDRVAFEISLPVKDSVALETGTEVKVFLDNDPLHPWRGTLRHAGYEPRPSPDQQMVYRLVAELEATPSAEAAFPRIGLRGTARIHGDKVSVFFFLFRRPITAVRQWLGW
ncbi:efflux RND transporter periplasmic adaptor subunit [Marinobacter lacisalsi]|uniref:Efflux RND transporter periplasmic adaptor subunit n=1 Tax=Marinobacter lacisalsi TaxID=475979 RepID=A0ABV8QMA6_9GAMM